MYTIDEIKKLRTEIRVYGLSIPSGFEGATDEELQRVYNGIGPEAWCPLFRSAATWLLRFFDAVALIHDYEYSLKEKSYARFTMANIRFAWNAFRSAVLQIPGQQGAKVACCGFLLALLCQIFGYTGYCSV